MKNKKYKAGNWMRCYFHGEFQSIDEASETLSNVQYNYWVGKRQFLISLYVYDENKFGVKDWILVKEMKPLLIPTKDINDFEMFEKTYELL